MNDFENKIMNEYMTNHALSLLRESADLAAKFDDVADPQQLCDHEMALASMYRIMYLSLREYHNSLSHILLEHGISLPDLDTLVSDSSKAQN